MLTDEQLVEASLQGSSPAFDELVDRYQGRLLRFLMTRSVSRADAEDAIQDTLISAYRYLASFNPKWRFSTWIYRIALRNVARQRRPEAHQDEVELVDKSDPMLACIMHSERENVWVTAKRMLKNDAFNAMWLRYVEDMSVKEIALALDKSVSWTKVTLLRGRRSLSSELAENETAALESESYG